MSFGNLGRVPFLEPGRKEAQEGGQDGVDQSGIASCFCLHHKICPDGCQYIQNAPGQAQDPVRFQKDGVVKGSLAPIVVHGIPGAQRDLQKGRYAPHHTEGEIGERDHAKGRDPCSHRNTEQADHACRNDVIDRFSCSVKYEREQAGRCQGEQACRDRGHAGRGPEDDPWREHDGHVRFLLAWVRDCFLIADPEIMVPVQEEVEIAFDRIPVFHEGLGSFDFAGCDRLPNIVRGMDDGLRCAGALLADLASFFAQDNLVAFVQIGVVHIEYDIVSWIGGRIIQGGHLFREDQRAVFFLSGFGHAPAGVGHLLVHGSWKQEFLKLLFRSVRYSFLDVFLSCLLHGIKILAGAF